MSFAPKDFSKAAWHGGPATFTNPRFQYRTYTPQTGKNAGTEQKNVTFYVELVDPEGNPHKAQYDVGTAAYCQIKEGPGKDADEAEIGPSVANPDPSRKYAVYPDSDFGKLMTSLVKGGYSEANLVDGDIGVLEGVSAEFQQVPRFEGDKFPTFLVVPGSVRGEAAPKVSKAAKATAASTGDAEKVASEFVVRFVRGNGGTTTQAALVKGAMQDEGVKATGLRTDVVGLLSKKTLLSNGDAWVYDADDKTVSVLD